MSCTLSDNGMLLIGPGDVHELVRGQEGELLKRLKPLVAAQSVTLDLSHVERIDAAGLATLISLYGSARDAGNVFAIANASPRVFEILQLVGLDRVLTSHNVVQCTDGTSRFSQSAA